MARGDVLNTPEPIAEPVEPDLSPATNSEWRQMIAGQLGYTGRMPLHVERRIESLGLMNRRLSVLDAVALIRSDEA